jgi:signal transduction histidine kinase
VRVSRLDSSPLGTRDGCRIASRSSAHVRWTEAVTQRPGAERGLGLIGVLERVAQLSATLRLESAPGKGTRLTVELAVRARVAAGV